MTPHVSNTYRFFVDPRTIRADLALIEDHDLVRQLGTVLRLRPGDEVLLLDDSGWQYRVALRAVERQRVAGVVLAREQAGGEPRLSLALAVALLRAERFELVLQKGTELGVQQFVPLVCARSAVGDAGGPGAQKLARWQRIIREAAEQSRRARLPRLANPQPFAAALATLPRPAVLLWEGEGAPGLRATLQALPGELRTLAVVSGPEGGLTDLEREQARAAGIQPVTLGLRTLRAETAPLAAVAAALYQAGDLE